MTLLIGIKSCGDDRSRGLHDLIRETWGQDVFGADLVFFVGGDTHVSFPDEVLVAAPDDFHSLPWKTREMARWAASKGYDYAFFCDTDTFVIPRKLMMTGYEAYDYSGKIDKKIGETFYYVAPDRNKREWILPYCMPWCSGGIGYFLSRKAMELIIPEEPNIWAEDLHVGMVLGKAQKEGKVSIGHLDKLNGVASFHYPHIYPNPESLEEWIKRMYRDYK